MPPLAHHLIWDTPLGTFEPAECRAYTIARALEHGTERDVAWESDDGG